MNLSSCSNQLLDCFSPKPSCFFLPSAKTLFARNDRRPKLLFFSEFSATRLRSLSRISVRPRNGVRRLRIRGCKAASSPSSTSNPVEGETESAQQLFEVGFISTS